MTDHPQARVLYLGSGWEGDETADCMPLGAAALERAMAPHFLAVALSSEVDEARARRIVRTIKTHTPLTHVVVLGPAARWSFCVEADQVIPQSPKGHLVERVSEALGADSYGPCTCATVAEAAHACLTPLGGGGFELASSWVRSSDLLPGDRHAMIPLSGRDGSGWLTISASASVIARLMGCLEPAPAQSRLSYAEDQALDDAANELANQMLGAFKRAVGRRGGHIEVGLPLSFIGTRPPFRHRRPASSLLVELRSGADSLWIDIAASPLEELLSRVPFDETPTPQEGRVVLL